MHCGPPLLRTWKYIRLERKEFCNAILSFRYHQHLTYFLLLIMFLLSMVINLQHCVSCMIIMDSEAVLEIIRLANSMSSVLGNGIQRYLD